jgi:peptidoglycan hydrolase CwlO-like protein
MWITTLVAFGTAFAVGRRLVKTKQQLRKHMAAINDLEDAILNANVKLESLQTAVDRITAAVDPSLQPRIADASANVNALGNALTELKGRIDRVV